MNTATTLLHDMRSQQLRALCSIPFREIFPNDAMQIQHWLIKCGPYYDTRNLSDKSLEEIDTLAGRYLDRVR